MEIGELQINYYKAFNEYLNQIREMLKTYSIAELSDKYPSIEWSHIRLASETTHMEYYNDSNINCIILLKSMSKKEQKRWMKIITLDNLTPTTLRKRLRDDKKSKTKKVKVNDTMKTVWLLKRRLKICNEDEREEILKQINDYTT